MPKGHHRFLPSIPCFLLLVLTLGGCNITRTAARFAYPIMDAGTAAFESESDLLFAEQAGPSNLKLLEGMLREAPNNRKLLVLASRGYGTYTFGFLDPKLEAATIDDPSLVPELRHRMQSFYRRAFDYGLRALDADLRAQIDASTDEFNGVLARQKKKDVPAIFWTAYAWGAMIQLDSTNPQLLSQFPKVDAMMKRVIELDPAYYYGGAHLFFAVLYAQLPPGGGGDLEASSAQFDLARKWGGGQLVMADVLEARYLAVREQNYQRYIEKLTAALDFDAEAYPDARLGNELAKSRAEYYLQNADAFFLDIPTSEMEEPL